MAKKRILLVDDEAPRMGTTIKLIERAGYEVVAFDEVDPFLDEVSRAADEYACALVDIMMPPASLDEQETERGLKTGLVVLKRLRKMCPDLPVIVLTVVSDKDVAKKALGLGAKACVVKPVVSENLIAEIDGVLASGPPASVDETKPGD